MIVNPRGWKTSEAWITSAGSVLTVICTILSAYLNMPGLSNAGHTVAILTVVYALSRFGLKGIALATGQAIPAAAAAPVPPVTVQTPIGQVTIDTAKTPEFSAKGGSLDAA